MTQLEFIEIAANVLVEDGYSEQYAIFKAHRILLAIMDKSEPQTDALADAGICENCLQAGWLVERENGNEFCLNCGAEYMVLEEDL